jgi:hypothetical protein
MNNKPLKIKWILHWSLLVLLITVFILVAVFFEDKQWVNNVLQSLGTIAGIYLTLIIFLHSKEESDLQFQKQLEHLQALTNKQIEALQLSTEKQINVLQELTSIQIEALQKSTSEEISAFEREIREVTDKLSDNSILLAEILGRELEKSIDSITDLLNKEQSKYKDLAEFKFLRTKDEKTQQLAKQWTRIEKIKQLYSYLVEKYNQVKKYLGIETKSIDKK